MLYKVILFALLAFSLMGQTMSKGDFKSLKFMSEDYPPYNEVYEDGTVRGPSVDVLLEIIKRIGYDINRKTITAYPWARSYNIALKKKGAVLFLTTYTEERKELFKWVGPVTNSNISIISKKSNFDKIRKEDLDKFQIGTVRADIGEQLLISLFNDKAINILQLTRAEQAIELLKIDRIKFFAYDFQVFQWKARQNNINPNMFHSVYKLGSKQHYFAFHKDTKDSIIKAFQFHLDEMKKDGTFDKIMKKHSFM